MDYTLWSISILIAGTLLGFLVASCLQATKADPPQAPPSTDPICCSHTYSVIDAQEAFNQAGGQVTLVLRRCFYCKEHTVIFLHGAWTIGQLLQTESSASAEIAELKRMVQ